MSLHLTLCATEDSLAEAWERFCGDLDFISIHRGSILDVACDAVVSPANSFGFMDGGIDAAYLTHFGSQLQTEVQNLIEREHAGELLVGRADIVATGDITIPYLIIAPTMRVPMKLKDSVNPYLAARAVFLLLTRGVFTHGSHQGERIINHVRRIAVPGLATGVGGIGANTCAHQVRMAIEDVILANFAMPRTWAEASERHQLLYTDRPVRLQH